MTKAWIGFVVYDGKSKNVPFGWKVIRWFSDNNAVHVFLVFKTGDSDAIVYQTSETIYMAGPLKERMESPCELYELPFDGEPVENECKKMVGTMYDYPGVVALGAYLLLERTLNWVASKAFTLLGGKPSTTQLGFIGNPFHVKQAYFCSESVVEAVARIHPNFFPSWWRSESVFPKTMRNFCKDKLKMHV